MTVNEFLKLDLGETLYQVIETNKPGWAFSTDYLMQEYGYVLKKSLGDCTVVGFEPNGKNKLRLYIGR